MDNPSLRFARTTFRTGYNRQEVDQLVDLIEANLALPLAERTLHAPQVTAVRFSSTTFRAGYDVDEVDHILDKLSIRLGLPSPAEPAGHTDELRPDLLGDRPSPAS
jgi:cell division septum initiation protein DivIVA